VTYLCGKRQPGTGTVRRGGADKNHSRDREIVVELCGGGAVARVLENATKQLSTRAALIPGGRMGSGALETLPVVLCPGCGEPMEPKGAAPVTRELDDVSYVCPKCGAETKRTMKRA
jgi:predicted RNA-binding Zn-ribbon protein involved in translation (DUF1610 family)